MATAPGSEVKPAGASVHPPLVCALLRPQHVPGGGGGGQHPEGEAGVRATGLLPSGLLPQRGAGQGGSALLHG